MANIYRKYNSYYFSIEAGKDKDTGKRHRVIRGGFKTKKEAQKAAAELEVKLNNGLLVTKNKDITFKDFMYEHWFKYHKNKLKQSSIHTLAPTLTRINKYFGNMKLKDITTTHVNDFVLTLSKCSKRSTVNITLSYLKTIFKYAIRAERIISYNPTDYVIVPKQEGDKKKKLYLEKSELKKFLDEAKKDTRNFPFYMATVIMAYTGMRIGEVMALQWEDIDMENKVIHVRKDMFIPNSNSYILQTPKTKTSVRDITISDTLIKEIKEYRKKYLAFKMRSKTWDNIGYNFVLTSVRFPGRMFGPHAVNSWMITICKRACMEKINPHMLRHTHVSLLAESGVPLAVIKERLGHSSSVITEQIYLHVTKHQKNVAADKFEEIMSGL